VTRSTKKRTTASARKKRTSVSKKSNGGSYGILTSRLKPILWRAAIALMVIAVAGTVYLDITIRQKFDGQKWALPAHLYTRPMELFVGQDLDINTLQDELDESCRQSAN